VFGVGRAILAGDALLALAMDVLTGDPERGDGLGASPAAAAAWLGPAAPALTHPARRYLETAVAQHGGPGPALPDVNSATTAAGSGILDLWSQTRRRRRSTRQG
jgi:hypothetical protein